ncbi:hypothetical protein [Paenibacillus physcomitrellae]|uniref:hypothetical protein n=1 Tax=Paenibacillus physcomitrellae TaxID=1619311 RepID=UPI00157FAF95|nr:hypothetical protein [Paenibacillus physcomitrellae]
MKGGRLSKGSLTVLFFIFDPDMPRFSSVLKIALGIPFWLLDKPLPEQLNYCLGL